MALTREFFIDVSRCCKDVDGLLLLLLIAMVGIELDNDDVNIIDDGAVVIVSAEVWICGGALTSNLAVVLNLNGLFDISALIE